MENGYYAKLSFSGNELDGQAAILRADTDWELSERIDAFSKGWNDRGTKGTLTVNKFKIEIENLPTEIIQFPLKPV